MQEKITVILLLFMCNNIFGQDDHAPSFRVPDNEYLVTRMVDELEEERKVLTIELKQIDRVKVCLNSNKESLASYSPPEKINKISELEDAFRFLNLKVINRNEYEKFSNYQLQDIARNLSSLSRSFEFSFFDDDYDFVKICELLKRGIKDSKKKINEELQIVDNIETAIKNEIKKVDDKLKNLYSYKGQNKDLHRIAIIMGLPAFCITILLLFLIPYYIERNSQIVNPIAMDSNISNKQYLLDVATVLLLTLTILILGLAKMITGEVLGTLLGGISGYVLNRTMKK